MRRLRTILVGAGKVGAGYAFDARMARYYPFASHAQVLAVHPEIEWGAVVDPFADALARVRARWNVPRAAATIEAACADWQPEVAVLATPPEARLDALAALPSVRAVIVEKPLGTSKVDAAAFVEACRSRNLLVQVNLWRRADDRLRELARTLSEVVGTPQAVFGLYGNGLRNNGTHMIDLCRMLFGELARVAAVGPAGPAHGPLPGDVHVPFRLEHTNGVRVELVPLDFRNYRENGLDIWGTHARMSILLEGLHIATFPRRPNRALEVADEIASDSPRVLDNTCGQAFFRMYDDLFAAMRNGSELVSPLQSALRTEQAVEAVVRSSEAGGQPIDLAGSAW